MRNLQGRGMSWLIGRYARLGTIREFHQRVQDIARQSPLSKGILRYVIARQTPERAPLGGRHRSHSWLPLAPNDLIQQWSQSFQCEKVTDARRCGTELQSMRDLIVRELFEMRPMRLDRHSWRGKSRQHGRSLGSPAECKAQQAIWLIAQAFNTKHFVSRSIIVQPPLPSSCYDRIEFKEHGLTSAPSKSCSPTIVVSNFLFFIDRFTPPQNETNNYHFCPPIQKAARRNPTKRDFTSTQATCP